MGVGIVTNGPVNLRDYGLCRRQVTGAQKHDLTFALLAENVHLAVSRDLVDAGMSARIRGEYQTIVHGNGNAVGHFSDCSSGSRSEDDMDVVRGSQSLPDAS